MMVLLKWCTQYSSQFGKLGSGYRTRKGQFSFQSQRRAMPNNVQSAAWLHSFHMLARYCSKSFKLGFNSIWPEYFTDPTFNQLILNAQWHHKDGQGEDTKCDFIYVKVSEGKYSLQGTKFLAWKILYLYINKILLKLKNVF